MTRSAILVAAFALAACHARVNVGSGQEAAAPVIRSGRLAQVYYWKARRGMLDQYNRYIAEVAEPIDAEARRQDAFVSVTTYMTSDTLSPWTHMRVFVLRDSAQLRGLGAALDAAGRRLEPDSVKRRVRGEYAATLRDRVGGVVLEIVP
jgi:hypothetical protein